MNIVLFSENDGCFFPASDARARHIRTVLKKKEGDTFEAGIENGEAGTARIIRSDETGVRFEFTPLSDGKKPYPLDLIVGFVRPIQLKRLFRDAAGLGVSRILLCGTETGEKSYMESKIVERGAAYEALKEGSMQAKSTHIPKLELFPSVKSCLGALYGEERNAAKAVPNRPPHGAAHRAYGYINAALDNVTPDEPLSSYIQRELDAAADKGLFEEYPFRIRAAIGSERGWTDNERSLFKQAGFALCGMGERVLRTETAATTATVIILNALEVL